MARTVDITTPEGREMIQRWIGVDESGDLNEPATVRDLFRTVVGLSPYLERNGIELTDGSTSEPVPKPPAILPDPEMVRIPHESDLSSFYGQARRDGGNQDWFNFPTDDIVLYTRDGAPLSDHTGDEFDDHKCHRDVVEHLAAAYRELFEVLGSERFHTEGWHVFGGAFNYRAKRGGSSLSTHSWGIAIDINPEENPYRSGATTFSAEAIAIMERHGFLSGGRAWGYDFMHFQRAIPWISKGSYYAREGLPSHIREA